MSWAKMAGVPASENVTDSPALGYAGSPIRIKWTLLIIGSLFFLLLFARLNRPKTLFFDEFGYVGVAHNLLHGTLGPMPQHFSESSVGRQHPPMGPYLIAVGIKIAGDNRMASRWCRVRYVDRYRDFPMDLCALG